MRILTLNYEYPPLGGGGGVIHQQIAEELARRHQVCVVTTWYRTLPRSEVVRGVEVHRVPVLGRRSLPTASLASMLSFFPASLRKGQEIIDAFRPQVINTHFAVPTGPSAVLLARRNLIPHVVSIHGGDIFDPSKRLSPHRVPGLRHAVRWVLERADRIVAQSRNTAENARTIYGAPRGKITVIPHGLRRPELRGADRTALGLPRGHLVLVTVGRLIPRKANHQLIEAVARLRERRVTLVLLGEGPERARLDELARARGVSGRVLMPGFVTEERKFEYLQAADVFVSTTLHEGFGLMFLEAMFCGLAVVAYDHGGQCDFIEDGRSGYLVKLNDLEGFRERLERLVGERELRERMGRHNLELAEEFTIERCAARYEGLFGELLAAGTAAPVAAQGGLHR